MGARGEYVLYLSTRERPVFENGYRFRRLDTPSVLPEVEAPLYGSLFAVRPLCQKAPKSRDHEWLILHNLHLPLLACENHMLPIEKSPTSTKVGSAGEFGWRATLTPNIGWEA